MANDITFSEYQKRLRTHLDQRETKLAQWSGWGKYYRKRIQSIYQFLIPAGMRVLEIGCGRGDLIASIKPSYGMGLDLSAKMVTSAQKRHPEIHYRQADVHDLKLNETFDFIILSDGINDLWDVELAFKQLANLSKPSTRLIINYFNRIWQLPLDLAKFFHLATPTLEQNWLSVQDTNNLLNLGDFEVIRNWEEVLCPLPIPVIAPLCNKILVRLWPFQAMSMTCFSLARPNPARFKQKKQYSVSVVIPARNEAGNIASIFKHTPQMGKGTQLIFVEGHSKDNTCREIENQIKNNPGIDAELIRQTGIGKGDAVRMGFAKAKGEMLMIMDADLTVRPEDLPRFYEALANGKGDFINGVRLVYPMEKRAMRFFNLLGNKTFSMIFSFLLGQSVKDTLCGTKVLWKTDYEKIASNRSYFGDFDPFGDYDLLFGAAKLNLKIVDMPIRYRERTYGTTNIQRWKHGWLLLQMVTFAARRLKFI
jgi:ubiquinone/menaquinone biosynthesis C-methylase UbiE